MLMMMMMMMITVMTMKAKIYEEIAEIWQTFL
jgi:hypothetical protein